MPCCFTCPVRFAKSEFPYQLTRRLHSTTCFVAQSDKATHLPCLVNSEIAFFCSRVPSGKRNLEKVPHTDNAGCIMFIITELGFTTTPCFAPERRPIEGSALGLLRRRGALLPRILTFRYKKKRAYFNPGWFVYSNFKQSLHTLL